MKTRKLKLVQLQLILFFVIFCNSLFSQIDVYKPFPSQYGTWIVLNDGPYEQNGPSPWTHYSFSRYEANIDTTIGSYIYKKVTVAYSGDYPYTSPSPDGLYVPYGPSSFCFAYRNDIPNKKVYIFTNVDGQYIDTLWYDFNLTIGDTIKNTFSILPYSNPFPVTSIDSIPICDIYHKRFSNYYCEALIEGVGFSDNFVQVQTNTCLDEPIYYYSTTFYCTLTSINDLQNTPINQIDLLPNPVLNNLQLNSTNQTIALPFEYSIVDCLGKEISKGTCVDDKSIDVSKLNSGMYFIRLQDKQNKIFQSKFLKQ